MEPGKGVKVGEKSDKKVGGVVALQIKRRTEQKTCGNIMVDGLFANLFGTSGGAIPVWDEDVDVRRR